MDKIHKLNMYNTEINSKFTHKQLPDDTIRDDIYDPVPEREHLGCKTTHIFPFIYFLVYHHSCFVFYSVSPFSYPILHYLSH